VAYCLILVGVLGDQGYILYKSLILYAPKRQRQSLRESSMCIVVLVDKASVDRYWELEEIARDKWGKILQKLLSRRRPATSDGQRRSSRQTGSYTSATTLVTPEKD
jgi:hypothetical protein